MKKRIYKIYKFTNKVNNKSYIGLTHRDISIRIYEHNNESKNKKDNFKFHQAINKYTIDGFHFEILVENIETLKEANKLEIFYIEKFDSYVNGYNMTKGGGGRENYFFSQETRQKMRAAKLGIKQSKELIEKRTKSMKGRKLSSEHITKLSIANSGKKRNPEVIKQMSIIMSGKMPGSKNPAATKINIYDSYGKLMYECNGNFESVCKSNKLPMKALRKSYYAKGKPIYTYPHMKKEIVDQYGVFKNWYAVQL